jgi:amino acid permease
MLDSFISRNFRVQIGIRVFIVIIIYALAMLVPALGDLVNIVGGVCSPLMGFILPPIFYMSLMKDSISRSSLIAHWAIVVFGIVAMITSLYMTIDSILHPN